MVSLVKGCIWALSDGGVGCGQLHAQPTHRPAGMVSAPPLRRVSLMAARNAAVSSATPLPCGTGCKARVVQVPLLSIHRYP